MNPATKEELVSTIPESRNPYTEDPDRHAIWDALVKRDYEAFLSYDWSICADDFVESEFVAYDAGFKADTALWKLKYPRLSDYRDEWLRQAREFLSVEFNGISKIDFLYKAIDLSYIELQGDRGLARKKFNASVETTKGDTVTLDWQSIFFLKKDEGRWKVTGFIGYLPRKMM
ncbi:MAG: hypothetical protein ABI443_00495 [Chthoniobacterales bacterium]